LDGRCSAAIVKRRVKRKVYFIETNYKDPPPKADSIRNTDVVIVDFSYKPEEMEKILKVARSVTWIDHHATAKDYPYQDIPGLRDFDNKSKAGCELTWEYFFPMLPVPLAVQLIGDYDKWALQMEDCKVFYEGMKLLKNGPEEELWEDLLSDNLGDVEAIIKSGRTATLYRDNYCNDLCRGFGYETEISGYHAYACNQYMFGSGGFGHRFNQYPLCIAYIHDGINFTVSLYSENVDVGEIAKKYGGGGHKGAAGFVCKILPFNKEGLEAEG
jgi:oligoribonuclease NrnB/cAMP/cGMP phosphodiesterase (DHH superfamily)